MDHFAGLDVSVKETSVCIVDDTGKIVREVKVASEPEALLAVLKNPAYHFARIGLEAGPLSQWLRSEEKHEPVSDIDTAAADSLKALDPNPPIREADIHCDGRLVGPKVEVISRSVGLANWSLAITLPGF